MDIGYIRVSTTGQNTDRQLDGIRLDRTFTDKASGGTADRPELHNLMGNLRAGDAVHVHSMDRLARNLGDLERIVREINDKGASVQFHKEGLRFTGQDGPMSTLLLQMLGAVAQFERALIKERQLEGIAIAKTKGVYKGRKPVLDDARKAMLKGLLAAEVPKVEIAKRMGISRTTLYEFLKQAA
jgi:DNA invertase Pin-like site-specific DNA recombinase